MGSSIMLQVEEGASVGSEAGLLHPSSPHSWQAKLAAGEMAPIWGLLYRLVVRHPLVRSASTAQGAGTVGSPAGLTGVPFHDLTQDLYLQLLQKGRFEHYQRSALSDQEIEREISQIELTHLLIGTLRRQRPEHYRLARRIGMVLAEEGRFRRLAGPSTLLSERPRRRMVQGWYGLRAWEEEKEIRNSSDFAQRIAEIPVRDRNLRRAGCAGDSQIVITSLELAVLLEEILLAIDSPASLRVLRQLTFSKLPLYDPVLISLQEPPRSEAEGAPHWWNALLQVHETPESILRQDQDRKGGQRLAGEFLVRLAALVRDHPIRRDRFWRILWHVYFDPTRPSQLEIAVRVGLSDSSVSEYRQKLQRELKRLRLLPEQLSSFAEALELRLRALLSEEREEFLERPQRGGGPLPPQRDSRQGRRSRRSSASIDGQGGTGDGTGPIRGQKEDHLGDLHGGDPALGITLRHCCAVDRRIDNAR
jgi:hypothetical protein